MDIRAKIEDGDYKTKLPWPKRPHRKTIEESYDSRREGAAAADKAEAEYREARDAYNADERRLDGEFYRDAIVYSGLDMVPSEIADRTYAKAWSDGHSAGLSEVVTHLDDIADLVIDAYKAGLKNAGRDE